VREIGSSTNSESRAKIYPSGCGSFKARNIICDEKIIEEEPQGAKKIVE